MVMSNFVMIEPPLPHPSLPRYPYARTVQPRRRHASDKPKNAVEVEQLLEPYGEEVRRLLVFHPAARCSGDPWHTHP
jgi:hypothetical protein